MKRILLILPGALVALTILNHPFATALAQGSLTPPGPPGPTMKTLVQIEPRTPISTLPVTLTNSGSYYLTTNVTLFFTFGIKVRTNNVSIDLGGFTITGSAGTPDFAIDIDPTSQISGVSVRNGQIRSFGGGVVVRGNADNVLVENVQLQTIAQSGISLSGPCNGAVIRNNLLVDCGTGIKIGSNNSNVTAGVTIANNRIVGGSTLGIEILAASGGITQDISVLNNQVSDTSGTAILLPLSTGTVRRVLLDGNHCTRDSGAGISVANSMSATVIRNVLTGCTLSVGSTGNTVGPTITATGILGTNGPAISPWANFQN